MQDQTITLSDGRKLGYQLLGEPEGVPLFFFHGTPGSRLVLASDDQLAQLPGVTLILPDRPGYGISDPQPSRSLLDWPADVVELADGLGVGSFAVAGISGGGAFALACAHALPQRVTVALLLSSPSPASFEGATLGMSVGNRLGLLLSRFAPWLTRWLVSRTAAAFEKDPEAVIDAIARQMSEPDRRLLAEDNRIREAFLRDLHEAYRQGGEGHAVDGALAMTSGDWGFDLREIEVQVFLWHGEKDTLVTKNMARHLEREIPRCTAHYVADAGHLLEDEPSVIAEMKAVLKGSTAR